MILAHLAFLLSNSEEAVLLADTRTGRGIPIQSRCILAAHPEWAQVSGSWNPCWWMAGMGPAFRMGMAAQRWDALPNPPCETVAAVPSVTWAFPLFHRTNCNQALSGWTDKLIWNPFWRSVPSSHSLCGQHRAEWGGEKKTAFAIVPAHRVKWSKDELENDYWI